MQALLRVRRRGLVTFGFLVVASELAGRSLTARIDRALHVAPLAPSSANYYPFLLFAVKVGGALLLAALAARAIRASAAAAAADRLLAAAAHARECRSPRLRAGLSFRAWAVAFVATSLLYLVHTDADGAAAGRLAVVAPLLHTYALPVFAVLAVFVSLAWRVATFVHAVEDYAHRKLARVRLLLSASRRERARHPRPTDDSAPRRRFGLAFECRPPPLPA
jgi:hypothetical protein